MRAMVMDAYGGTERLSMRDLPRPAPGAGQLLLRVLATSVNPVDWKVASGELRPWRSASFPHVPGFDVAGEVVERGAGVQGFEPGSLAFGRLIHARGGASAELCLLGTDVAAPIPAGMDPVEAAGLPLAGITALQGLRDDARLPLQGATQRVLIVGASGGVGHLGLQIALAAGAHVTGVCSGRNVELVRGLGASEVIDYTRPDPYKDQRPFDVILDCVGGSPFRWTPLLTATGIYASPMPAVSTLFMSLVNPLMRRKVRPVMLKSNAADLRVLCGLVEAGKLRVVIGERYPLEALPQAWERSISGRAVGKIGVVVAAG
jgi:NADPH:quinone reductase-like Zn-dependent oxidoreductase